VYSIVTLYATKVERALIVELNVVDRHH